MKKQNRENHAAFLKVSIREISLLSSLVARSDGSLITLEFGFHPLFGAGRLEIVLCELGHLAFFLRDGI